MGKESVWLGALSNVKTDPRPLRARSSLLQNGYQVRDLLLQQEEEPKGNRFLSRSQSLFWGCLFHLRISRAKAVRGFINASMQRPISFSSEVKDSDIVLLFDLDLLPFVVNFFPRHRIVLDFREIYTEQFGRNLKFLLFLKPIRRYILKSYTEYLSAGYTVSRGLIDFYHREFKLNLELIRSLPTRGSRESTLDTGDVLRLVYLGGAHPLRGLRESMEAVTRTQTQIEFHLYLVGNPAHIASLERVAQESKRIFLHPPVEFSAINTTLSEYDLGWCYFTPKTENLRNTLPNKFFDYVQAGLGIVAGPNHDMIQESSEWDFGIFCQEYSGSSITKLLDELTQEKVQKAKQGARAAKQNLVWDVDESKFIDIFLQIGAR